MYRLLLRAFPREFRRRFGEEMAALFADRRRDARAAGLPAYVGFWLRTLNDVTRHGWAERRAMKRRQGDAPMLSFLQDVRFAFRFFRQRPGFAAAAVLTLALGIGITVAAFSIVNGVLIRWQSFPNPEQLVRATEYAYNAPQAVSAPFFRALRQNSRDEFSSLAAYRRGANTLTGTGDAASIPVAYATPELFDVIGVSPVLGRPLTAGDGAPGSANVVISNRFWRGRLGGDPQVLGKTLELDSTPATIVGVIDDNALVPPDADVWRPLVFTEKELAAPRTRSLRTLGRLKPGATVESANAAVARIAERFYNGEPDFKNFTGVVLDYRDDTVRFVRRDLLFVQAVAIIVLLVGCANIANLLLVATAARQHELSIRASIGAGRWRLVRQLLAESLVLSTISGAAGLLIASWLVPLAVSSYPGELPGVERVGVSLPEFVVAVGAAFATTCLFGLLPAVLASRADVSSVLKGGPRSGPGRLTRTIRWTLVAAEIAMSLALVAGAALLVRNYARLTLQPIGFDPRAVLTAQVTLPADRYPSAAARRSAIEQLLTNLQQQPGVLHAAAAMPISFDGTDLGQLFLRESGDPIQKPVVSSIQYVSHDYLQVFKVPLIRGRFFSPDDRAGSQPVMVVNEKFAATYAADRDVLGLRLRMADQTYTVVGVVADGRFNYLQKPKPFALLATSQQDVSTTKLAVRLRTDGNPDQFTPQLQGVIRAFDPRLPVPAAISLEGIVAKSVAVRRFNMTLLAALAALALMLSVIGIYGVMAYVVNQERRNTGIRLALGAAPGNIQRFMVRQGLTPILFGLAGGFAGAWYVTALLKKELFEIKPHDPWPLALAAVGFLVIGVLACWVPSRRSARVNPVEILRAE